MRTPGRNRVRLLAGIVACVNLTVIDSLAQSYPVKPIRIRSLAVTSANRVSFLPAMPTIGETGLPGYAIAPWYGILVPAGVPKDIIALLNAAIGMACKASKCRPTHRNNMRRIFIARSKRTRRCSKLPE